MNKYSFRITLAFLGLTTSCCLYAENKPFLVALNELYSKENSKNPEHFYLSCEPNFKKEYSWALADKLDKLASLSDLLYEAAGAGSYKNCKLGIPNSDADPIDVKAQEPSTPPIVKCDSNSDAIQNLQKQVKSDVKYYVGSSVFIFDENQLCFYEYYPRKLLGNSKTYRNNSRLAVGDDIYIATTGDVTINFDACKPVSYFRPVNDETDEIVQTSKISLEPTIYSCDSLENKLIVKSKGKTIYEQNIAQQERYRATFQIGIVRTSLNDQTYTTFDYGDGTVIRAEKEEEVKHPIYTGSLVLYGLPHYISSFTKKDSSYLGRDLLNDNQFFDRVGLGFTFGLSKPEDLLGIGLTFELASGINLTYSKLWKKVNVLDGYKIGDQFSGAANTIPTKETWNDENVVGISIDGRYLSKFFSSGK